MKRMRKRETRAEMSSIKGRRTKGVDGGRREGDGDDPGLKERK